MKVVFDSKFAKDLKNLPDREVKNEIAEAIEVIEKASKLSDIPNLRKMKGARNAYRLRVRNFRLGFFYRNQEIEFVRCLDRKDIYKKFP